MKSNIINFTKSQIIETTKPGPKPTTLSRQTLEAGIELFEEQLQTTIAPQHRERFLDLKITTLSELKKAIGAYKVFGDLCYGKSVYKI
jgi:hypothetical protein